MKNILIIKTHAIGDVLMTTPAIRKLRLAFPDARITVMVGKWSAPILKNNPHISRLIEFDDAIFFNKNFFKLFKLIRALKNERFDAALLLHASPFIHSITALAGIKQRFGVQRSGINLFLTHAIKEIGTHDYYYPKNFLRLVDFFIQINAENSSRTFAQTIQLNRSHYEEETAPDAFRDDLRLEAFATAADRNSAKMLLNKKGVTDFTKLFLIAPGGASNPKEKIPARLWPVPYFVELLRLLHEQYSDHTLLVSGSRGDAEIIAAIKTNAPFIIDLCAETNIQELIAIAGMSTLIICNDSAVLHIGISQNKPAIGLFGPSSLKSLVTPSHVQYCIQSPVRCAPCYWYGVFIGCKNNFSCMKSITPKMVFEKVQWVLSSLASDSPAQEQ